MMVKHLAGDTCHRTAAGHAAICGKKAAGIARVKPGNSLLDSVTCPCHSILMFGQRNIE